MVKSVKFTNRNNLPYGFPNKEYNKTPEELIEKDPAPFPDLLAELPGIELAKNCKGVPATVVHLKDEEDQERTAENAAWDMYGAKAAH